MTPRIAIDTCVLVSALRSSGGASYRLVTQAGTGPFEITLSVPLVLEYEDAAKRIGEATALSHTEIDDVVDYLCSIAHLQEIHFLWRPVLRDPRDDHVLELAVEADCGAIVTHNVGDFAGAIDFGIDVIRPGEMLRRIGGTP